jgi:hypothetical protein
VGFARKGDWKTMQRRKFIAGMGSLAAAGAAGIGTGAFTSVEADRTVDVEVADDSSAYLRIVAQDTPNGNEYVDDSGGTVSLDITGDDDSATNIGSGLNDNATTIIDDILTIENQGTQGVYVGYTHPASPNGNFALYHEDSDFTGPGGGSNYDAGAGNYNNDGQLNINTAPDADTDGNPDLVYLDTGEALENIGVFFFGSPDVSAITADPITFKAGATFDDL